jgi:methanogenic corrinoid protein MtbC1
MLEKVPAAAAAGYAIQADSLVADVNARLKKLPDVDELIGRNPLEVMEMNHKHHAQFMSTVFKTNSYELLARTVPWVYRVYTARDFKYDYFVIELHAWIEAIEECLSPEMVEPLVAVYNWMLANHEAMKELSLVADSLSFDLPDESDGMQQIFLALLLNGDHRGAISLAEKSVENTAEMQAFYHDVITPSLSMIGALWEKNEVSVAQEHLASAIVTRVMTVIYAQILPAHRPLKGVAVVTAAPNEFHEIGARMVADLLEIDGWDVIYLGANTPRNEIVTMVERMNPFILCISAAVAFNLDKAEQTIAALRSNRLTNKVKIMAGGLAFNAVADIWRDLGADGHAADAVAAVRLAGSWWERRADVPV